MNSAYTNDRPESFLWTPVEDGIKVTGYTGGQDFIAIPGEIDGKPVVEIGCTGDTEPEFLFSVLFPASVKRVDPCALPDANRGYYGSYSSAWIRDLKIHPDNPHLKIVDGILYADGGRTLLRALDIRSETLNIPADVTAIAPGACLGFSNLKTVTFPEGLLCIGAKAFYRTHVTAVTFPESLEEVGYNAFWPEGVHNVKGSIAADAPTSLRHVSYNPVLNWTNLHAHPNFRLQDDLILSADGKTLYCPADDSLGTDLTIPDGVEEIASYAFFHEAALKKVTFPATLKVIRSNAFGDNKVKTLRLPASLEVIEENAFHTRGISSIILDKKNRHFFTDKTCFFRMLEGGNMELLLCFRDKLEEYTVPEGTVSIAPGAFSECHALASLHLPQSLTELDSNCLGSAIRKLTVPANVRRMLNLKTRVVYTFESDVHFFYEDGVLYQKDGDGFIALRGIEKRTAVSLKDGTTAVAPDAFRQIQGIKALTIPAGVKQIGANTFARTGIETLTLSEGLESIGGYAFADCSIKTVIIPASVHYISPMAFWNCPMEYYQVADGSAHYNIMDGALLTKDGKILLDFPAKSAAASCTVPETVEDISRAFYKCTNLKEIRLPASVKSLWDRAIVGCKSLRHLYLDEHVEYMDDSCIDYDFPITIHTCKGSVAIAMVERLGHKTQGGCRLQLSLKGMENISQLSKEFSLLPNDTGLTIVRNLTKEAHITVPAEIGGYAVTKIGPYAFAENNWGNEQLLSVTLPDSVTEIGEYAFNSCRKLQTLTLPKGIRAIPFGMLVYCEALTELVIPEGVETLAPCCLFACQELRKIVFPASVKEISEWIFACKEYSGSGYQHRDLYLNNKTVYQVTPGSYAETFLRAYKPDKWDVEKLTVLYQLADEKPLSAAEQAALTHLDDHITEDGTVSVKIKTSYNDTVTEVVIPASIRGLPVTELRGLGSIPTSLKKLTIPASITRIEGLYYLSFYQGGHAMESIVVAEDNPVFWSDGQALYTKDRATLIHMMDFQAQQYTIHPDTKIIGEEAFAGFENLQTLILSSGSQEIRKQAFYSCRNLEHLQGVESVPKIAEGVLDATRYYANQKVLFNGSVLQKYAETSHTTYTIPDGTTIITSNAFYVNDADDQLESVIIPDSVTEIGNRAFSGRKKLRSIRLPGKLKKLEVQVLRDCGELRSIHIPAGVEEIAIDALPCNHADWRNFISVKLAEITVDENNPVFMAKNNVLYSKDGGTLIFAAPGAIGTEFTVPDHVHTIGTDAFRGVDKLETVHLSDSVKIISPYAFQECRKLQRIDLTRIEFLGKGAFHNCPELKAVILNLADIPESAFSSCRKLSGVTLNGVKTIGNSAFSECAALTRINLPEGLEEIGAHAFAKCGLKQVVVPKSVRKVNNESFSCCPDITVYDSIDPDAKAANAYCDDCNGSPNSLVGFIGIGPSWAMWQCAANHSWVDHRITVRSAETDEIKFMIPMVSDPRQRSYYCTLTSSWGKNAGFNFDALDTFFPNIKGAPIKLEVAVSRLRYPVELNDSQREAYISYLTRAAKDLVKSCIDRDDMDTLLLCEPFGILKKNNIDDLLEYASKKNAVSFSAYLLEYKNTHFAAKSTAARLPSLSAKPSKASAIWQAPKSGTSKIGRYKGTDTAIEFPKEFNGTAITGIAGTTSKVPENYKALVSVVIPEGYTTIGDYAFHCCENLESVTLPSTLESIGKNAFSYCVKLKEIIMPDSVLTLEDNCFYYSGLEKVHLSTGLTAIPTNAFYGTQLRSVDLPAGINRVYKDCFYWCRNLKDVYYHGASLTGFGQCFSPCNFHCYTDAKVDIYGVTQKRTRIMTIAGQVADTFLTLKIGDAICNFFLESCAGNMRAHGSTAITRLFSAAAGGKGLAGALDTIYGGKLLTAANNAAELQRLEGLAVADTVTLTEEKKHADGTSITIFTYTAGENGTMKVKETLSGPVPQTPRYSYGSYYNSYAATTSKPTKPTDDFVDITDSDKAPAGSVFQFTEVAALEFSNKIFVLTGFGAEEEQRITDTITAKGGQVKSSVVQKTDYLIVQESYDHETAKYKKAQELNKQGKNIAIIGSIRFYELS